MHRSGQGGLLGLLGGGEDEAAGVRGGPRRDGAYPVVGADPTAATRLADRNQTPLASHAQGIGQPLRDGGFTCCPGGPERCAYGWAQRFCRAQAQLFKKLPIPWTSWVAKDMSPDTCWEFGGQVPPSMGLTCGRAKLRDVDGYPHGPAVYPAGPRSR
ncbi:hypothetical protein GCM10010279_47870 [Streptomyces mutabilis]|nr:hypothetical protein GCM10010279_47870 [Streptomyces mutabilis]